MNDELSKPDSETVGSLESIPHCVTFSGGKAIYSPRGGLLANSSLFIFDYTVVENDNAEFTIEVEYEEGKPYKLVNSDEINLYGIVYSRRREMPNPGYLVSTLMTHRILIDSRELQTPVTMEFTPGPADVAEECSDLPLQITLEPNTIKSYEVPFMCGKGYGTYLEGAKFFIQLDESTAEPVTSTLDFDSRYIRGLRCSGGTDSLIVCDKIEL